MTRLRHLEGGEGGADPWPPLHLPSTAAPAPGPGNKPQGARVMTRARPLSGCLCPQTRLWGDARASWSSSWSGATLELGDRRGKAHGRGAGHLPHCAGLSHGDLWASGGTQVTVALVPGRGSPDSHPQPHSERGRTNAFPARPGRTRGGEACALRRAQGQASLCRPTNPLLPHKPFAGLPAPPPLTLVPDVGHSLSEALDDQVTRMLSAFFNER